MTSRNIRRSRSAKLAGWGVVLIALSLLPASQRAALTGQPPAKPDDARPVTVGHAVFIGVDAADDLTIPAAEQADADARLIYQVMTGPEAGGLSPERAKLLTNREATSAAIRQSLTDLRNVGNDDLVFLFFAGRLLRTGRSAVCVTSDTNAKRSLNTGLAVAELGHLLTDIPSQRLLIILDGRFPAREEGANVFEDLSSIGKALAGPGRTVIVNDATRQKTIEVGFLKNGAFARFLTDGLKGQADGNGDGAVSLAELWPYLQTRLADGQTTGSRVLHTEMISNSRFLSDHFVLTRSAGNGPVDFRKQLDEPALIAPGRGSPFNDTDPARASERPQVATPATDAPAGNPSENPPANESTPDIADRSYHNSLRMQMIRIPAGSFQMGSELSSKELSSRFGGPPDWYDHEHPRHLVRITKPFYLSAQEVTVGQFKRFVDDTGYRTEAEKGGQELHDGKKGGYTTLSDGGWGWRKDATWRNPGFRQSDNHPVVMISWNDANAFCRWLSQQEERRYRLASEAEWEYACRAGNSSLFWWGNESEKAETNYPRATPRHPLWALWDSERAFAYTTPVGRYQPNAHGLYDVTGNVWEWCGDWYASNYYAYSPSADPHGPAAGVYRVVRGGSWGSNIRYCRSARRNGYSPSGRHGLIGFRLAADAE